MKLMDTAAQCTQLLGGFGTIGRFGKTLCAACKRLIGTQHQTPRQRGRNRLGLGAGQMAGYCGCIRDARFPLHGTFVDLRRSDLKAQAGRRENLAANVTPRSKHERLGGKPKRHDHATG